MASLTTQLSHNELHAFLEEKVQQYNQPNFLETDPLGIPHRFSKPQDIEIAGFLAATIAWGQRATIIKNANRLMEWMEHEPYQFIVQHEASDREQFAGFVHRTFNGIDCRYFLQALQHIYKEYNTLETAFAGNALNPAETAFDCITRFRQRFFALPHEQRTEKHVSNPEKNASAKRLNMYLRWMVRNDNRGVDFGLWKSIAPAQLMMPLDVYTATVGRKLGLLTRKQNDRKSVEELTASLRAFDAEDPVKYDFALFGLGVFEGF